MNASLEPPVLAAGLAPLSLLLVALLGRFAPGRSPRWLLRSAQAATVFSFLVAVGAALVVARRGPLLAPALGMGDFSLSLRLDPLSVVMFLLVSAIGVLVVHFSRNYLAGDENQSRFIGDLGLTLVAVLLLVLAGNLFHLVAAWIGTSLALHRLLVFYGGRRGAVMAARKKFVVARLGDLFLVAAALILARTFGTTDLAALAQAGSAALASGSVPAGAGMAGILVVLAAALKSAVFPFHGWLLEVMETPTPVSALLHAGLINAGTFLVVRLGDLIFLLTPSLHLLIVVGGFTALFASVAMLSQSSVKVSLAYSSAAHMGFMLMLCGFGAHSVAIMHLVAHSFYKAHAFLSSGSVVDYVRHMGTQPGPSAPRPLAVLAGLLAALGIFVALGTLLGIDLTKRPGEVALGAVFVMATTQLLARALGKGPRLFVILRTGPAAAAVTLAFFGLELSAAWILGDTVAVFPEPDLFTLAAMVLAVAAFAAVSWLHVVLPSLIQQPWTQVAYVHLKNGLYANAYFDRIVGTWRRSALGS